jgi:hypothetical protein
MQAGRQSSSLETLVSYYMASVGEESDEVQLGIPPGNSMAGKMALSRRLVTPTAFACRVRRQRAA